jgi:RNA polymerase sigma factor (sigma-70 family)
MAIHDAQQRTLSSRNHQLSESFENALRYPLSHCDPPGRSEESARAWTCFERAARPWFASIATGLASQDREDLFQQFLLKLCRVASNLSFPTHQQATAYLRSTARSVLVDDRTARIPGARGIGTTTDNEWTLATIPTPGCRPEEMAINTEKLNAMQQALSTLPLGLQEVVQDWVSECLSDTEIATKRGIPLGSVKSRKRRALELLTFKMQASR